MSKGRHISNVKNNNDGKQNKKVKKHSKKGSTLLLGIFAIMFIISSGIMVYWLKSNYDLAKIEKDILDKVATVNNPDENGENASEKIDFKSLEEINTDVKAWIYIKDTDINYPILQANDNDYYLKRNIYKKYSSAGSIFLDCNNKTDFTDENTIVYGHNLKNKKMFADIIKIYNGELGDTVEIEIYTKEKCEKYEVISVYSEEPSVEMIKKVFKNSDERKKYVENCITKSKVKFQYKHNNFDNILTLVTCDASGYNRVVLNAQKK